jgi:hypothetical protein
MRNMEIVVHPDGTAQCVYSEDINLSTLGLLSILRASHVEPTAAGQWLADLSPVGGPTLGPFSQRSQALAAEQAWLAEHWLA